MLAHLVLLEMRYACSFRFLGNALRLLLLCSEECSMLAHLVLKECAMLAQLGLRGMR